MGYIHGWRKSGNVDQRLRMVFGPETYSGKQITVAAGGAITEIQCGHNGRGYTYFVFFSSMGTSSIFAARIKSFSLRPPMACVQSSIATLR